VATDAGLTKTEILETVQGYRQRFAANGANAALERQFERDKDDIRELGVPLETIPDPADPTNNQAMRYRIPKGAYELPADLAFTAEESALLGLAAMVWREGSLSSESRRATMKLRSLGHAQEPVLAYAPRLRAREAAWTPLSTALERNQLVRFDYLKPGEQSPRPREVEPLALVQFQGRWMLHAHDPSSDFDKTFLLGRITSKVQVLARRFTPPEGDQTQVALDSLRAIWAERTARVRVESGSEAATRLRKRRDTRELSADEMGAELELHYADLALLADELASAGPEVLVLEPPQLVAEVRDRLRQVVASHG
jgi:proteasome accessory factor B